MSKFYEELKRRNVIKATIAYLVVAWVLLQVATILLDTFHSPDWVKQAFTAFLAIGLPVWIIISWIYDITPKGIEKTTNDSEKQIINEITNKRLNIFIIVSLVIAVIVLAIRPSFFSSDKKYTIAVLPFENLSVDEDKEWYSDGVTSGIHTYLSNIKNFHIISLQTVEQYRGTEKTTADIAKELEVSFIVYGSLRQLKNRIVITAHLIKASSDKQLWGENYDKILDDNALKIQQEVSKKIVLELKNKISPEDTEVLDLLPTNNQVAYEAFKKGKAIADKRKAGNRLALKESSELYKKAIALDSNYADAYAELALMRYLTGVSDPDEIKYLNEKALEINPNTARVYSTRGLIYTQERNFEEAKENFEKALEINPNDATTHQHYAFYYSALPTNDNKNWLIHIRKGQKLNPHSNSVNNGFLYALLDSGKLHDAEEHLKKINYVYPDYALSNLSKTEFKGLIKSYQKKDFTEVIKNMLKVIEVTPNDPLLHWYLGDKYNAILNDDANYLKYSRIAFKSDSTSRRFGRGYFISLLENKKFDEASKLLNNNEFEGLSRYYLATDSLEKALEYINKTDNIFTLGIKLSILAKMGERDSINNIFKNHPVYDGDKALVYSILKEKDSMYHYLNKSIIRDALYINGNNAFNPYRNEPRYKAYLKKNYLPVTD